MKTPFDKEPHFENESSFQNAYWKWKHVFGKVKFLIISFFFPGAADTSLDTPPSHIGIGRDGSRPGSSHSAPILDLSIDR